MAWVGVTRGAHRLADVPDVRRAELLSWQLVLPASAVFTHLTAAASLGLWLPPLPPDLPMWIATDRSSASSIRPGVRTSRHLQAPAFVSIDGVRTATVPELLLACSRDLEILDLVVLIDSALHTKRCQLSDLLRVSQRRARGAPRLRRALTLTDARSESAWETLLRLLHIVCGVPVVPQYDVRDDHGEFLARADLWIAGTRTLHEYDGAHHLQRRQQRADLHRVSGLTDNAWARHGFTKEDVLFRGTSILRSADAALGRDHDAARIRKWHALLGRSLHTPSGTALFQQRLGLLAKTEELGAS